MNQLVGFIQEEKSEFERHSDAMDMLNSSQYVSKDALLPAKQKVLKS